MPIFFYVNSESGHDLKANACPFLFVRVIALLLFNQQFSCVILNVFVFFDGSFGVKHERFCNTHDLLCPAVYVGSADVIMGVHVVSPSFKVGLDLTLNYTILIFFSDSLMSNL